MKINFDKNAIFKDYADSLSNKLDKGLEDAKKLIDERTPELTWALIEHNKIKKADLVWSNVVGNVYNDLWEYEMKVEENMGFVANFHKYDWTWWRYVFKQWIWAFMFRDWFEAAKDILIDYLKEW